VPVCPNPQPRYTFHISRPSNPGARSWKASYASSTPAVSWCSSFTVVLSRSVPASSSLRRNRSGAIRSGRVRTLLAHIGGRCGRTDRRRRAPVNSQRPVGHRVGPACGPVPRAPAAARLGDEMSDEPSVRYRRGSRGLLAATVLTKAPSPHRHGFVDRVEIVGGVTGEGDQIGVEANGDPALRRADATCSSGVGSHRLE